VKHAVDHIRLRFFEHVLPKKKKDGSQRLFHHSCCLTDLRKVIDGVLNDLKYILVISNLAESFVGVMSGL
jgi:hypothetical protein